MFNQLKNKIIKKPSQKSLRYHSSSGDLRPDQFPAFLTENNSQQQAKFHNLQEIESARVQSLVKQPTIGGESSIQWSIREGLAPENFSRNRYSNIIPFDHNRVRLGTTEGSNDYINASLISLDLGPEHSVGPKEYIATQGPTRDTSNHFWQMLYSVSDQEYHADSMVVLMITPIYERGREACAPYWPSTVGTSLTIPADEHFTHSLTVYCESSEKVSSSFDDTTGEQYPHTLCELKLTCSEDQKTKTVYHIYVDTWVDFDRPTADGDIFNLVRLCNSLQASHVPPVSSPSFAKKLKRSESSPRSKSTSPPLSTPTPSKFREMPLVVHCSAGVGRTGTYLVLDYMLTRSKLLLSRNKKSSSNVANYDSRTLSASMDPIYQLVLSMREQRMGMVQRISQYRYIYENVRAAFVRG